MADDIMARFTRISGDYLAEALEAEEEKKPPKLTKAEKKAIKKEAKLQAANADKRLIMRVCNST